MARGRIRLITIGSRFSRERQPTDLRYLEVLPLQAEASKQIALSVGLDERDADLVAQNTEGYPGLALTLAKAIRYGEAGGSLIGRVRGHEELGSVLSSLLPPDDVLPLGMLALFEKLGFDDDLAQELSVACETFGVDERRLREIAGRELRRFVSTAGRFRRVTPRLFAVWLASQFMRDRGGSLAATLTGLPESLRDRIVVQMREFAGDPVVAETLGSILDLPPFREGALGDVGEGAGRLLHVAAIAAPEASMAAIERVLAGVSVEALQAFGSGRREMVWALEVLLWFESLFDRAADALLRLAIAENETWANNATGVLQGAFRIFLGGTSAPYTQRLQWAERTLRLGPPAASIVVDALGHAFEFQESRSVTDFGGRTAPAEWKPKLLSDEMEARGGAWDLLIRIARGSTAEMDHVAKVLARGLQTAIRRGLSELVLRDVSNLPWSTAARALLGDAVAKVLKYDKVPEEAVSKLQELQTHLQGSSITERLGYTLSLSPWQLGDDEDELVSGRPRILKELAAELVEAGSATALDAAARSRDGDAQTAGVLFEELARRLDDEAFLTELEALDPAPEAALVGMLTGLARLREDTWADRVLERWLESPSLASLVIRAAHRLPASDMRAQLAITAVDRAASSAVELGRFLYGAWARPLAEPTVVEIGERLAAAGGLFEVEHGLGILEQWTEDRIGSSFSPELRLVALDLISRANQLSDRGSPMISLHRSRVLRNLGLGFDERLSVVIDLFRSLDSFADEYDLESLDALVAEDAARTVDAIVDLICGEDDAGFQPWLMWLDQAKVLSRLERTSPELVINAVTQRIDRKDWPRLVDHIDISQEPSGLLTALLDRTDDPSLRSRASFRFMYPETAWTGPESAHLRARRRAAEQWLKGASPQGGYRAWLDETVHEIDRRIETVEAQEAEQDY